MTIFRKSLIAAVLPLTMTVVPAQAQIIDIDLDLGDLLGVGLCIGGDVTTILNRPMTN